MKTGKVVAYILGFFFLISTLLFIMGYCSNGAQVAMKEYSPSAMLKKYEYFKDMSAAIDSKRANIDLQRQALEMYSREDPNYQITQAELLGIISIHNDLCSEYNSAMSKFNYRFCNKGTLPESNLTPLPKEMKPYINKLN